MKRYPWPGLPPHDTCCPAPVVAQDAEFNESDHPRDEEGKFSHSSGSGKPHRRDAAIKRVMQSPAGWEHMEDEDGNSWRWSDHRDGWVASHRQIGGEGWHDNTHLLSHKLAEGQKGLQAEIVKGAKARARSKRIIPRK